MRRPVRRTGTPRTAQSLKRPPLPPRRTPRPNSTPPPPPRPPRWRGSSGAGVAKEARRRRAGQPGRERGGWMLAGVVGVSARVARVRRRLGGRRGAGGAQGRAHARARRARAAAERGAETLRSDAATAGDEAESLGNTLARRRRTSCARRMPRTRRSRRSSRRSARRRERRRKWRRPSSRRWTPRWRNASPRCDANAPRHLAVPANAPRMRREKREAGGRFKRGDEAIHPAGASIFDFSSAMAYLTTARRARRRI